MDIFINTIKTTVLTYRYKKSNNISPYRLYFIKNLWGQLTFVLVKKVDYCRNTFIKLFSIYLIFSIHIGK